jgi:hypothetical protein
MVTHARIFPMFFCVACRLRLKRWRPEIFSDKWQRCTRDVHALIFSKCHFHNRFFWILNIFQQIVLILHFKILIVSE